MDCPGSGHAISRESQCLLVAVLAGNTRESVAAEQRLYDAQY